MKPKFTNCLHLIICILSCLSFTIAKAQIPVLWGTANFGGLYDKGSIFRVNGDGSNFNTVFSFDSINGSIPKSSLCAANNGIVANNHPVAVNDIMNGGKLHCGHQIAYILGGRRITAAVTGRVFDQWTPVWNA